MSRHPKYNPYDVRRKYPNPEKEAPTPLTLKITDFRGTALCSIQGVQPFGDMQHVLWKIRDKLKGPLGPERDMHMYVANKHGPWIRVKDLHQEVIDYLLDNNDTIRIATGVRPPPDEEPDITIKVYNLNTGTWTSEFFDVPNLKPTDTFRTLAIRIVQIIHEDNIRLNLMSVGEVFKQLLDFKMFIHYRNQNRLVWNYDDDLGDRGLGDQGRVWIWQKDPNHPDRQMPEDLRTIEPLKEPPILRR